MNKLTPIWTAPSNKPGFYSFHVNDCQIYLKNETVMKMNKDSFKKLVNKELHFDSIEEMIKFGFEETELINYRGAINSYGLNLT